MEGDAGILPSEYYDLEMHYPSYEDESLTEEEADRGEAVFEFTDSSWYKIEINIVEPSSDSPYTFGSDLTTNSDLTFITWITYDPTSINRKHIHPEHRNLCGDRSVRIFRDR